MTEPDKSPDKSAGYPRKRAQTRRRLLAAGMTVLARRGPDGATVGEIAGEAGVASGTFYNHFPSIMDLVEEITADLGSAVEISSDTLTEIENDPAARVAIGATQMLSLVDEDPTAAAAFVALLATTPAFRQRVRSVVARAIDVGVGNNRFQTGSVTLAADAVLGAVVQWMRSALAGESSSAVTDEQLSVLLRMLGLSKIEIEAVVERARYAQAG